MQLLWCSECFGMMLYSWFLVRALLCSCFGVLVAFIMFTVYTTGWLLCCCYGVMNVLACFCTAGLLPECCYAVAMVFWVLLASSYTARWLCDCYCFLNILACCFSPLQGALSGCFCPLDVAQIISLIASIEKADLFSTSSTILSIIHVHSTNNDELYEHRQRQLM